MTTLVCRMCGEPIPPIAPTRCPGCESDLTEPQALITEAQWNADNEEARVARWLAKWAADNRAYLLGGGK